MIELFRNRHFIVRCDSPRAIVEVVRTAVAFTSAHDAAVAFTPMLACLDALGRARFGLLFDARDSIAVDDPNYEAWYARHRMDMVRDFRRVAILMRTPVGSLQATRLLPNVPGTLRVFLDAQAALNFLTDPGTPRPSRRPSRV